MMIREKLNIIDCLGVIANLFPIPVCWLDKSGAMIGMNYYFRKMVNIPDNFDPIGKTAYDIYSKEIADNITKLDQKVIETGKNFNCEEMFRDNNTGETHYLNTFKSPLYGDNGEIIGIVGISIDITAEKKNTRLLVEAEKQKLENSLQQTKISDQEIFRKDVGQLIHDINTPLSTIQIILEMIKDTIPESERLTLKSAVGSIKGMTGNLLSKYRHDHQASQTPEPTLISLLLTQVLEESKIQSANTSIAFSHNFNDYDFSFININQLALKRSITNLLNNAVEAMEAKTGTIHLELNKQDNLITITIKDNGRGMSAEVLTKLRNNIAITSGKKNGHGIGFTQIYETVTTNQGTISIESIPSQGTTVTLAFPEVAPPNWLTQALHFNAKDTIVILDDDDSIHGAWDLIFKKQDVTLKHFTQGSEAIAFINSFPDKTQILLLSDFELLNQNLNGIDVIGQTKVRAILVTSHYSDKKILKLVQDNNIKLLPKQLASEATVIIGNPTANAIKEDTNLY